MRDDLQKLAERITINGPDYRGDQMPPFDPLKINESEFSDKLRMKNIDAYYWDGTVYIEYISQESDPEGVNKFVDEVKRCLQTLSDKLEISEDFEVELEIRDRYLTYFQTFDFTISKGKDKIEEAVKLADLSIKLKDYYSKYAPTDYQLEDMNPDSTFEDLYTALKEGRDVYEVIGDVDSMIREVLFDKLSKMLHLDYDEIYDLWLYKDRE